MNTLEERIKINELERANKARQENIIQLESKARELDQKLQTLEKTESHESIDNTEITEASQSAEETTTHVSETIEEEPEEVVEVSAIENPIVTEQENYAENLKIQNEKKKRKFF